MMKFGNLYRASLRCCLNLPHKEIVILLRYYNNVHSFCILCPLRAIINLPNRDQLPRSSKVQITVISSPLLRHPARIRRSS